MTWRHVACIIAACALPVVCGFSAQCSATSLKEVIGLSSIVVAGILGNAMQSKSESPK
jgi:hypothetical protein